MRNKRNTEEATNVRNGVIDFSTIDTVGREDDEAWNSLKFYGESDDNERGYRSPNRVDRRASQRIRARHIGIVSILSAAKASR